MQSRFVILKHSRRGQDDHWDLMLEAEDVLWTWRLGIAPADIGDEANAERIFDHPKRFLDYRGPVNQGQGTVEESDSGLCDICAAEENCMEIQFHGRILSGRWSLEQTDGPLWQLARINR